MVPLLAPASSFRGGVDRGQPVREQLAAERRGGIFADANANREEVCFLAARVRNGVFAAAIQKNDRAAGATHDRRASKNTPLMKRSEP